MKQCFSPFYPSELIFGVGVCPCGMAWSQEMDYICMDKFPWSLSTSVDQADRCVWVGSGLRRSVGSAVLACGHTVCIYSKAGPQYWFTLGSYTSEQKGKGYCRESSPVCIVWRLKSHSRRKKKFYHLELASTWPYRAKIYARKSHFLKEHLHHAPVS